MGKQEQTAVRQKRMKIAVILLAALLVLSAGGLAGVYIYSHFSSPVQSTAAVPDNLIGEESASEASSKPESSAGNASAQPETSVSSVISETSKNVSGDKPQAKLLELYQGKPEDNRRFEVRGMLPGDTETGFFCVKAHHSADITLFFRADITEQTKKLGDVLRIKVTRTDNGKVLCDAPFNEIDGTEFAEVLAKNTQGETAVYYRIDASLDTSVGNEYQSALLKADFEWYVKDDGGLTPPQTGDRFKPVLWAVLAASSFVLVLLLALWRRKEERHE